MTTRSAVTAPSADPAYERHARIRLLAQAILMDYGVPPALAVACGQSLILGAHAPLESMCREAWGEKRLDAILFARGGAR